MAEPVPTLSVRPWSMAAVLSQTIRVYGAHFLPFTRMAAGVVIPVRLLKLIFSTRFLMGLESTDPALNAIGKWGNGSPWSGSAWQRDQHSGDHTGRFERQLWGSARPGRRDTLGKRWGTIQGVLVDAAGLFWTLFPVIGCLTGPGLAREVPAGAHRSRSRRLADLLDRCAG